MRIFKAPFLCRVSYIDYYYSSLRDKKGELKEDRRILPIFIKCQSQDWKPGNFDSKSLSKIPYYPPVQDGIITLVFSPQQKDLCLIHSKSLIQTLIKHSLPRVISMRMWILNISNCKPRRVYSRPPWKTNFMENGYQSLFLGTIRHLFNHNPNHCFKNSLFLHPEQHIIRHSYYNSWP